MLDSIENITIPSSLVSIGSEKGDEGYYGAFSQLSDLKQYNVDDNNPVFKSIDGALLSKDGKILYSMPCKIGKYYTVPDGVELIAASALANTKNMTVTIPASVKYLGSYSLDDPEIKSKSQSRYSATIFNNSSDITLNVSSKTEIRDIFENLPELCEMFAFCSDLTVNFVD